MNVFIVYAHPEPRSLNGSLKTFAVDRLTALGHNVRVSDLYAMRWKAAADGEDFLARDPSEKLDMARDSGHALVTGTQSADIAAEQQKLLWADAVILQFPMWWYSMPAILKGWVDRVYAYGFAYGVGEHSDSRWGERFGEGTFSGKRAMVITTTGGWAEHYSARGINGPIDELLFPINHGILYYPGFDVLPPFVVHRTGTIDAQRYAQITDALAVRLARLFADQPIPYRRQNYGDYEIPALTLKEGLEEPRAEGFGLHVQAHVSPERHALPLENRSSRQGRPSAMLSSTTASRPMDLRLQDKPVPKPGPGSHPAQREGRNP